MSRTLKLVLKYKWFDMIESNKKPEEYREISEHNVALLFDWRKSPFNRKEFTEELQRDPESLCLAFAKPFDMVEFYRGYSKTRKKMTWIVDDITIGKAKPELSDNWKGYVFIIKLQESISVGSQYYMRKILSGTLARIKGGNDGANKNPPNPPAKEGYYHEQYMRNYETFFNNYPF